MYDIADFRDQYGELNRALRRALYAWRPARPLKHYPKIDFDDISKLRAKIKRLERKLVKHIWDTRGY